jgi:hypothetical protein
MEAQCEYRYLCIILTLTYIYVIVISLDWKLEWMKNTMPNCRPIKRRHCDREFGLTNYARHLVEFHEFNSRALDDTEYTYYVGGDYLFFENMIGESSLIVINENSLQLIECYIPFIPRPL